MRKFSYKPQFIRGISTVTTATVLAGMHHVFLHYQFLQVKYHTNVTFRQVSFQLATA